MLRVSYLKFSVAKAKSDHSTRTAKVHKVRAADIDVHRTEGLLRPLSFEFERYGPHAYHGDDIAFLV